MKKTFRFDDICVETDMENAINIAVLIVKYEKDVDIVFGVSPITYGRQNGEDFINRKWLAISDHKVFYNVENCGIPEYPNWIITASHGLVHIDHRFLSKETQEFSIVTSCNLVKSKIFIPPFNKWNKDTECVCREHKIELIKFEDGWRCCEYEQYDPNHDKWYLHSSNLTVDGFRWWLRNDKTGS